MIPRVPPVLAPGRPAGSVNGAAVLVGGLCLVVATALNAVLVHETGLSGDEPYYTRIAAHPGGPHNFPYAFRLGIPYLVHVLPFSSAVSWELLALVCAAVAAGALFALLRDFEVDPRFAAGLAVCFVISPPVLVVLLRNGRGVDVAAILVITLGSLFIVRRQRVALAVALLIGTTIHETCLFLIPLAYATWAQRPVDREALRDVALVAVLPVLVYVYIRTTVVAVGQAYQPGYTGPFFRARWDLIQQALGHGAWKVEVRRLAIVYGPLWIAAPFALRRCTFAQRGLVLVGLCVLAMTYAVDWGRVIFFAAPVFYVAGAYALRRRSRLAVLATVVFLALDFGYAGYMQFHGVKHGLDSTGPPARGPVH
ncbi:MAG: hypothetical protein ACRDNK_19175 [Solirubrobacteraceae bacterium]